MFDFRGMGSTLQYADDKRAAEAQRKAAEAQRLYQDRVRDALRGAIVGAPADPEAFG